MTPNQKTVILHIGAHKTGSTAIQLYLYNNRAIAKQNDILYPQVGCPDFARFGQHLLAWSCLERDDYLPVFKGNKLARSELRAMNLWGQLDELIAAAHSSRVVLSSEEFSVLGEEGVECVYQKLGSYNVRLVIYLRRQDEFLESAYGTSVIYNADTRNFYDFSQRQRTNLDYFEMVSLWGRYFGQQNIVVRSYEDLATRENVVKDFLSVSGLNVVGLPEPENERVNVSQSAHLIEVIRGLRLRGWSQDKLDHLQRVSTRFQPQGSEGVKTSFMSNEYRESMHARFELSNRQLRDVYGCDLTVGQGGKHYESVVTDFCDSFVRVISEIQDGAGFVEV